MNQAIIFPDRQEWDSHNSVVRFPAQSAGALIECAITAARLTALSNQNIDDSNSALRVFEQYRFDIEELAEALIEDEAYDEHGFIWLD
ncbi:DUF1488 domain-containing protein [Vibrio sp. SM6]|uniref:DUF1488 domain-containing protein n=1 Tax=Vibrio agarilyticus TaxID=2726741 RepID=A0A7X8TT80_9VIBR|nr:DUF1488 domain-containing protein [Vibrio agarilyticus]NLS14373.1 DUF1488 domain-containing protein [Vibrio agarilyticus]